MEKIQREACRRSSGMTTKRPINCQIERTITLFAMAHFTSTLPRMDACKEAQHWKLTFFLIIHLRSSLSRLEFFELYYIFLYIFLYTIFSLLFLLLFYHHLLILWHGHINKREVQFIAIPLSPLISSFTYYFMHLSPLSPQKK